MDGNVVLRTDELPYREPTVQATDPGSGREVTLYDPYYKVLDVPRRGVAVDCKDVDGFVSAVRMLIVPEGAAELVCMKDGEFVAATAPGATFGSRVSYKLAAHPTAGALCLAGQRVMSQRALVQYGQQWPGVLVPMVADGGAQTIDTAWQSIEILNLTGSTGVVAQSTGGVTSLAVQKTDGVQSAGIPEFWRAKSPVYDGGCEAEVVLRMQVQVPEADGDSGKIKGELGFAFTLWSPAAKYVTDMAVDDAMTRMRAALGDGYAVIHGSLSATG